MSVDAIVDGDAAPAALECALCGRPVGGDALVVQCYPENGRSNPGVAAADGSVAACEGCADEVRELLAAWSGHADPPVGADRSIAEGYRRVADDCSFCERPVGDDPILGVERYRRGDDPRAGATAYANYSLCGDCAPVFDRFLDQVRDAGRS